jgi:hypothetical protein
MPVCNKYPVMGTPDWKAMEKAWDLEITKRRTENDKAWKFYDGDFDPILKPEPGSKLDDNVTIPLVTIAKDQEVSAMQGTDDNGIIEGIKFEVAPPDLQMTEADDTADQQTNPAQDKLDKVLRANRKNLFTHKAFLNGGVTGHTFVKIQPLAKTDSSTGEKVTRWVVLDSSNTGVFWHSDDMEIVTVYRIESGDKGKRTRQDIVQRMADDGTPLGGWDVYDYKELRRGEWASAIITAWDYPFPPIVDWQDLPNTRQYYGKSDTVLLGKLNIALNFIESNKQRIIKYHAHPRTLAIGISADSIQNTAVDGMWAINAKPADVEVRNLEMQSDLKSSSEHAMNLRGSLFDVARELDPRNVQDKLGDLTNFALRVLYSNSLGKRHTKWLNVEEGLRRLCQYTLVLEGIAGAMEMEINIIPPDPLPQNEQEKAQALDMDTQHGLSNVTYLERRGYDAADEKKKREEQRAEQVADQSQIGLANAFGNVATMGRAERTRMNARPEPAL